jgi:hypothetical protein
VFLPIAKALALRAGPSGGADASTADRALAQGIAGLTPGARRELPLAEGAR